MNPSSFHRPFVPGQKVVQALRKPVHTVVDLAKDAGRLGFKNAIYHAPKNLYHAFTGQFSKIHWCTERSAKQRRNKEEIKEIEATMIEHGYSEQKAPVAGTFETYEAKRMREAVDTFASDLKKARDPNAPVREKAAVTLKEAEYQEARIGSKNVAAYAKRQPLPEIDMTNES